MINVWYVKIILANCDGNLYLSILRLPRVELDCKLQEKLHCVTEPLQLIIEYIEWPIFVAISKFSQLQRWKKVSNARDMPSGGGESSVR